MTEVKKITIMFMAAIVTVVAFVSSASAAAPSPNYGAGITVDGDYSDWDLGNDYFADMYRAGDPTKVVESKLYLRYDCAKNMMYALVLEQPPAQALENASDAWIAINTINNKVVSGESGNFAWVSSGEELKGWEGSFSLANNSIHAHLQVYDDAEDQTSRTNKDGLSLVISCPEEPPGEEWMGCTPGYWKNHPEAWVGYSSSQTIGDVFGLDKTFTMVVNKQTVVAVSPDDTLMKALNYGGGSGIGGAAQILMRAATAALLNEDKFGNDYPPYATEQELINA